MNQDKKTLSGSDSDGNESDGTVETQVTLEKTLSPPTKLRRAERAPRVSTDPKECKESPRYFLASDNSEKVDDTEPTVVPTCGVCITDLICKWSNRRERILQCILDDEWPNNKKRYECYKTFIRMEHGPLRKGERYQIPDCVLRGIRLEFPDPLDDYTGYQSSDPDTTYG